jgi:glycosyltransferase involved in cell wall biosynthesis
MNIAVDAFPLTEQRYSGIPNYLTNIFSCIASINVGTKFYFYAIKDFFLPQGGPELKRFARGMGSTVKSYENTLWLFTKGARMMKKDDIDIFWGTRQMLPPCMPSGIRKVLTVYDLVPYYFPETMESYNRVVMKLLFSRSVKAADHIMTISRASARSLQNILKVPEERITVIYPAADGYVPLDRADSSAYISEKYGTNRIYILTVSTVEPRKNLKTLLKVFAELRDPGFQLLIAGASGWKTSGVHEEYERLGLREDNVKFLGYVPDEDMNKLYSGAGLFVFPSLYEGFGIPPLEAMASGTPVIVSSSSSLPEVVGDAGILVDPYDIAGWKENIAKVTSDAELQNEMRLKGIERAKLFSWEKSARQTLQVFERFA